jgi:hypothetical protein
MARDCYRVRLPAARKIDRRHGDIAALYREKARRRHPNAGGSDTLIAGMWRTRKRAEAPLWDIRTRWRVGVVPWIWKVCLLFCFLFCVLDLSAVMESASTYRGDTGRHSRNFSKSVMKKSESSGR